MKLQTAFTFASVHSLDGWHRAGLCSRGVRQIQAFSGSGAFVVRASDYCFCNTSVLMLRSALACAARVRNDSAPFWPLGLTRCCSGSALPPTELSR